MEVFLAAFEKYGAWALCVAFFLYRDFIREKATVDLQTQEREFSRNLVAIVVSVIDNYEHNSQSLTKAINNNLTIGKAVLSFLRKFEPQVSPDSDDDLPTAMTHLMELKPSALKERLAELLKNQTDKKEKK